MEENPGNRQNLQLLEKILKDMLKALMFLADRGSIHRDVKPANILCTSDWSAHPHSETNLRFVPAGFGLSGSARPLGVGTPLYIAPEMTTKGVKESHKIDVYSLGATIHVLGDASRIASTNYPSDVREVRTALESALQDQRRKHMASMLCQDPMEQPSAQDFYLSRWPDESKAREMTRTLTDQSIDS
jgi:serine/threonine protein kinase